MMYASSYGLWFLLSKGITLENRNEEMIVDTILNQKCYHEGESQCALMTHLQHMKTD